MVNLVTCIFHFFKALTGAFEGKFLSVLHVYTISVMLVAFRAMQLRFFKVETLSNNAFK